MAVPLPHPAFSRMPDSEVLQRKESGQQELAFHFKFTFTELQLVQERAHLVNGL